MTCRTITDANGVTIIACSRGSGARAFCEACGKHRHAKLCDFPLMGSKKGTTCDRKLCESCAVKMGRGLDYCAVHARVAKQREDACTSE